MKSPVHKKPGTKFKPKAVAPKLKKSRGAPKVAPKVKIKSIPQMEAFRKAKYGI